MQSSININKEMQNSLSEGFYLNPIREKSVNEPKIDSSVRGLFLSLKRDHHQPVPDILIYPLRSRVADLVELEGKKNPISMQPLVITTEIASSILVGTALEGFIGPIGSIIVAGTLFAGSRYLISCPFDKIVLDDVKREILQAYSEVIAFADGEDGITLENYLNKEMNKVGNAGNEFNTHLLALKNLKEIIKYFSTKSA